MNNLEEGVKKFKNKKIYDNFLLYETCKSVFDHQLKQGITTIFYNEGVIYIETINQIWANQMLYYKLDIMKKIKRIIKNVKEIKIYSGYSEIKKTATKNKCKSCGSQIISESDHFCSLCIYEKKEKNRSIVAKKIKETPWISYEDLENSEKGVISYIQFSQEKAFQISKVYDRINLCYREYQKNKQPTILTKLKILIEEYIILKTGILPDKINKDMIKNHLSSVLYKYYQENE